MKTHFLITAALTLATINGFSQSVKIKQAHQKQAGSNHPTAIINTPIHQSAIKKVKAPNKLRLHDSLLIRNRVPINRIKK